MSDLEGVTESYPGTMARFDVVADGQRRANSIQRAITNSHFPALLQNRDNRNASITR